MAALEQRWESAGGSSSRGAPSTDARLAVDRSWHDDVALEIWVDVTADAVVIRLEGVLDASTGANLTEVVRGCQAEGRWDFDLDTGALRIDRTGWPLIDRLREQVHACGGRLHVDSTVRA